MPSAPCGTAAPWPPHALLGERRRALPASRAASQLDARDLGEIDVLLAKRLAFKKQRCFDEADRVQDELRALGVETDDRNREWRVKY